MREDLICKIMLEKYHIHIEKINVINRLLFRRSYHISGPDGSFVIKYYPKNYSIECLRNIKIFTDQLINIGMDTLQIIQQIDGEIYFECPNGIYVVFSYLSGVRTSFDDVTSVALLLKDYHKLSTEIKENKMKEFNDSLNIDNALLDFKRFYSCPQEDELISKIIKNEKSFIELIEKYKLVDKVIVHGDFTLNNVIKNNGVCYIIDYDTIRLGNYMEDVSVFSLSLCYTGELKPRFNKNYVLIIDFLIKYFGKENINEETIKNLVYNMKFRCAYELTRHALNYKVLKRYTGMLDYLNMLVEIVTENEMEEILWKELLKRY